MDSLAVHKENIIHSYHPKITDVSDTPTEWHQDHSTPRPDQDRALPDRSHLRARRVTLEDLAAHVRMQRTQTIRFAQLRRQRESITQEIALAARLVRTQRWTRRALMRHLISRDKAGFADCFQAIQGLKDSFSNTWVTREFSRDGTTDSLGLSSPHCSLSLAKLTARSRAELQELLRLVRMDTNFIVDRIRCLPARKLEQLASSPEIQDRNDVRPGSASQARLPLSAARRNAAFTGAVKDRIGSLERHDSLSVLLHNVWNANNPLDASEAERRLHTWSSVCARLFSESDDEFGPLICRILNEYADLAEWRARPRLEVFLRSVLQEGAFLLGYSNHELSSSEYATGFDVSLHTKQATEFFDRALKDLFSILDDAEGGLPRGSLELGSAILGKLPNEQTQGAFRGFLLYTWFFGQYLKSFVLEPESHGSLLDQHIRPEARDRVLQEVSRRAQAVVYMVFDNEPSSHAVADLVRPHVNRMNNKLILINPPLPQGLETADEDNRAENDDSAPLLPLILAPAELVTLIDTLYPRSIVTPVGMVDPFTATNPVVSQSNVTAQTYSNYGTAYGTMYLHDNIPIHAKTRAMNAVPFADMSTPLEFAYSRDQSSSSNTRRFESLRRDLESLADAGAAAQRPFSDGWISLDVHHNGRISWTPQADTEQNEKGWGVSTTLYRSNHSRRNITAEAAIRLAEGFNTVHGSTASSVGFDRFAQPSAWLERLFEDEVEFYLAKSDSAAAHFWWTALRHIREHYPVCCLSGNDTKILEPLIRESTEIYQRANNASINMETQLAHFQIVFNQLRVSLNALSRQLENFRDKMWYMTGVRDSQPFDQARKVATALHNMCLPESPKSSIEASIRQQVHQRPSSSSLLNQAELQTGDILKAPPEQGGPKKLADEQIEWIKRWMEGCSIDNFCVGEERFHRFCLEIRETVNKLVVDNMIDGRFLWSSELFARERSRHDILSTRSTSAHNPTRPPSVVSDEGPSISNYALRGQDVVSRPASFEPGVSPGRKGSIHSFERWRSGREASILDTASASDSPGRTISTVPSESLATFWSPAVTQAQSTASIYSTHSRPASVHTDIQGVKGTDPGHVAKTGFLQRLRSNLASLLLSDLCCPVWSTGCETDAWITNALCQQRIRHRIRKRASIEALLADPGFVRAPKSGHGPPRLKSKRSMSVGPSAHSGPLPFVLSSLEPEDEKRQDFVVESTPSSARGSFSFVSAFENIITCLSAEADPRLKLQNLKDLLALVAAALEMSPPDAAPAYRRSQSQSRSKSRRWSQPNPRVQPKVSHSQSDNFESQTTESFDEAGISGETRLSNTDRNIIDLMKKIFMDLRPRTLFRDLQLVSAFVDPAILAESDNHRALLLAGLAALAFKEDVCRTLVGIADKVIMQDSIKRRLAPGAPSEFSLIDAINFWIICAKEGNAIAQREIATLYLTHSSLLPKATSPMSLSKDTFNSTIGISLRDVPATSVDPSAMQLAVHWMQLAAQNGDKLAQSRLRYEKQQH